MNDSHEVSREIGNISILFDMKYEIAQSHIRFAFYAKYREKTDFFRIRCLIRLNLRKHPFIFRERCFLERYLETIGLSLQEFGNIHGVAAVSLIEKRADTRHI